MKTRSFILSHAILFAAFTVNTVVMAQSHDSKNPDSKGKTTVTKTEINTSDVKQNAGTTTHQKTTQTKGGINTVNKDVKTNPEKDMKKTESEVKQSKTTTEKKINEKHKK